MDHAFIGCTSGAPEGEALLQLGFVEGSANTHPGQGTANRRFFFDNFMLELVWVADPAEAQNERTRRTRLWERCQGQDKQVSPFGIIFRSTSTPAAPPPFVTWSYTPLCLASRCAEEHGLVSYFEAPEPLLEILFEGPAGMHIDLRPELPLVFRSD